MERWMIVAGLTLGAGLTMPLGAAIAQFERIRPRWLENEFRHGVVAFGGGALLAAVALVLVPEGTKHQSIAFVAAFFALGGVSFALLDIGLHAAQTPASQLAAMLADFLPEALAMGAAFAAGSSSGPLLAGLIALQNLPEGFNAYRELTASPKFAGRRVIASFLILAFLGPAMGLAGYFWLSAFPPAVSGVMLFASGGILYLIFQDIAPQAKLEKHWAPTLGAIAGFLLGLVGHLLLGG